MIAAVLHLAIIFGGPGWYRFFGAGEGMAQMAARGEIYPTIITLAIASILALWAAYAFSGAGLVPPLPLLKPALVAIAAIFLLRALCFIPAMVLTGSAITPFAVWSSAIVLGYGLAYAIGTWLRWPILSAGMGHPAS